MPDDHTAPTMDQTAPMSGLAPHIATREADRVTDLHQLTAIAALHSLRQAYAWIPDVTAAATIPGQTRQAAVQTERVIARRGTLYAAELAERREDQRITPAGAHPMPIRPELVGLGNIAERAMVDAAWITSSALYRRPSHWAVNTAGDASPVWWPRTRLHRPAFDAASVHLRLMLPRTPPAVALEAGGLLDVADRHLRGVLGVGPAWIRLPYQACPECRRRSIEAEVSSESERDWTIRCEHGCVVSTVEDYGRARGRLVDLLALIRSVRRQGQKRAQHKKRERRIAA